MTKKKLLLAQLNQQYPIRFSQLQLLREGGGRAYLAQGDAGAFLLKAVSPAFRDTARRSVQIVQYLAEQGFPVPPLIKTKEGGLFCTASGKYGETLFLLFRFLEGREPGPGEKLEEIGALSGRLHELMGRYPGRLTDRDQPYFIGRYIDLLRKKRYPEQKLAEFIAYGDALWSAVKGLPRGFCHGDLHRGNLLLTPDGQLYVLDLDTACMAFPMFDIAVLCDATDYFTFHTSGYDAAARSLERFLMGYERIRRLTEEERASFYDWIAIRHYQLQATILELHGLDCVDEPFLDRQLDWLKRWREQCARAQ